MAGYDTSIRVKTEIDNKKATVQLASLENRIVKTADKVHSLRSEMDAMKNVQLPTEEYREIQRQIEDTEKKINSLLKRQEKFLDTGGKESSTTYKRMQYDLDELQRSLPYLQGELQDLVDTGKAFTLGNESRKYEKDAQQIKYLERELSLLNQKRDEAIEKQREEADGAEDSYKKLANTAKNAFTKIEGFVSKANDRINSFGKKLKNIASRILPTFRKETERSDSTLGRFSSRLKSLLSGILIFNVISSGFRKTFSGISEGFKNLYDDNEKFRRSVDSLKASAATLKNSLAAAFRPLVEIAIPYIQKTIEYLTRLTNAFAQFLAAITGQKTYTRAIKQTTAAIEDQNKAQNKQLSNLDKLNNLTSDSGSGDSGGSGQLFEEVPVSSYFADLAGKVKDVLSKLFAPLKEAWNREGKFVMDSWKYALTEIKDLAKSIGSDFLEVWQQEKTIKIFEDILHIVGDIGLVAGNLAHNFRLAWEENETGKKILEGVRDIIGVIVHNIRHAADVTADWSSKLNFSPLLTKIQEWVNSLVPVFDTLSGVVTDFYEKVLLPLGKWTIEKGLPELFQVLADFNAKVDWEALRTHLAEFWDHVEPFAETVGEGLIIFLERVSDLVANFLNSDVFVDFLHSVEEWMDSVTPEDVADAIGKLITALLIFKGVAMGLSVISTISSVIGGLATAFSLLTSPVGLVIAAIALLVIGLVNLYRKSEGFRDFVNGIIDGVKLMIDWFKNLGTEVDVVREKVGATRSWAGASSNMGSIRPRASAYSTMVSSLQNVEFPGYATGQVIPRSMKQHLAILGDNNKETEVVSPISTLKQAMMESMTEAGLLGRSSGNSGGNNVYEFSVDGEVFFRIMEKNAQEYKKQHGGKTAFT